jgi:hypothetical protein
VLPVERRVDWWVDRVAAVAAPVAATPRVFGVAADRLPIQAALGASAQGLAVCAVAREHGVTDPDDWVPLLGRVLLDRDLPTGDTRGAEAQAAADAAAVDVAATSTEGALPEGVIVGAAGRCGAWPGCCSPCAGSSTSGPVARSPFGRSASCRSSDWSAASSTSAAACARLRRRPCSW